MLDHDESEALDEIVDCASIDVLSWHENIRSRLSEDSREEWLDIDAFVSLVNSLLRSGYIEGFVAEDPAHLLMAVSLATRNPDEIWIRITDEGRSAAL